MSRLLVVEDDERLRAFAVRTLEAAGHVVAEADTGPDGVRKTYADVYDLVVLDLMLPGYDGFEVLRRILNHDPEQRVLVLSAVGDVASRVQCLRMGATDYLMKPFAGAELVARVQARLRTPKSTTVQRWLRVGQATMDLERQILDVAGQSVSLTHRELLLVGYLMRRPGEVCSRDELLSSVWGYDSASNVVEVTVRRIRGKMPLPMIETVRNAGYMFSTS